MTSPIWSDFGSLPAIAFLHRPLRVHAASRLRQLQNARNRTATPAGAEAHEKPICRRGRRSAWLVPLPRTPPRAVTDVMNDHFVVADLIHDQVVADRKSSESGFACCLSDVGRGGNSCSNVFNASDESRRRFPIVCRYVCKNLIEIDERTTLISQLHAFRYRLKTC